jgi:molybdate transport system substrate-binding protein
VVVALTLAGCGAGTRAATAKPGDSGGVTGDIAVFAAASLTESFTRLGKDFEAANPGSTQITQSAPADVYAAASTATMKVVTDAGDADGAPVTFVRNQLVIAVPKGNPKGIKALSDLGGPGLKVALCAEQVPCGAAAKAALNAAGVRLTPVTLEKDVKSALGKVKLGEVDAALVYRTDARSAVSDVDGIGFPESAGAVNDYPIVVLKNAPNMPAAQAFVAYVQSYQAKALLTAAGFQTP